MAVSITSPPSYWTHKRSQAYFLEDVPDTRSNVIGIVKSSWDPGVVGAGHDAAKLKHSEVEITEVKRVENTSLFYSYSNKQRELEKRKRPCPSIGNIPQELANFNKRHRSPAVNEYYLFHGTEEALRIAKTGFQTRYADPDNMFGKGIYFSDSFQKADQYTDDPENRTPLGTELTIIMARVLLGHTYKCSKEDAEELERLPCLLHGDLCACGPQQRYDSVESTDLLFKEFAVFEGRQCYPEYIITYKRTGKQLSNISGEEEVSQGRNKKKKRQKNKPKSMKQPVTWQEAVQNILGQEEVSQGGKKKKEKRQKNKPKRMKQPMTCREAVQFISATLDGRVDVDGVTKLTCFWQKTRTEPPVFEFTENRHSVENRWMCVCRIHFPVENIAEASGRRKKIAKRLAAELMLTKLKSM